MDRNQTDSQRDELNGLVEMIENQDHTRAQETIAATQKEIPGGYRFSHYIVTGVGNQTATPDPQQAIAEIQSKVNSSRLEVTAVYKNPNFSYPDTREFLVRSILYLNPKRNAIYLNGQEVAGEIDFTTLEAAIMSHNG